MDNPLFGIFLVLLFILIGGVFSASELALVSLRDSQVQRLQASSRRGARVAHLREDSNRFLAAVQIGVTLAGFFSAAYGGSTIGAQLVPVLTGWGVPPAVASTAALVVITAVISYLSLVLGELVPKRLALQRPEAVALFVAPMLDRIATAARPAIWLLSRSTNAVVRLLGLDPDAGGDDVTEEELRDMVRTHDELGAVERQVLSHVFDSADRHLTEVMVPRTEVVFLDASTPLTDAARAVVGQPHSRYPVIRGSSDDVVGFIHIRDLLTAVHPDHQDGGRSADAVVGDITRPITALPGSKTVLSALTLMRSGAGHIALVVDEYGGTDGIVTMEDLIEELVGEIQDEFDRPRPKAAPTAHGEAAELDGRLHRDEVQDRTGIVLPEGRFDTLGGFLMTHLGRVPVVGDSIDALGHRFTVLEMDRHRPTRILVTPITAADTTTPASDEVS
jgi:putative hemolysin